MAPRHESLDIAADAAASSQCCSITDLKLLTVMRRNKVFDARGPEVWCICVVNSRYRPLTIVWLFVIITL